MIISRWKNESSGKSDAKIKLFSIKGFGIKFYYMEKLIKNDFAKH